MNKTSDDVHEASIPSVTFHFNATQGACPNCGQSITGMFPVAPLFSIQYAADIIPCTLTHLTRMLRQYQPHLGMPIYKRTNRRERKRRLLRAWEIQFLRNQMLFTREPGREKKKGIKVVRVRELFASDMERLYGDFSDADWREVESKHNGKTSKTISPN